MERYIGIDIHAASCTLAVISEKGRKLKDFPVETNGQALVEAIRIIPGQTRCISQPPISISMSISPKSLAICPDSGSTPF